VGHRRSIVYNYVDLVLRNDTDTTFQLSMTVGDTYLEGELLADRPQPSSYKVYAARERFFHAHGEYFRTNQLPVGLSTRRPATRSATSSYARTAPS